jgi:glycosyltransferase 2 family protein
VPDVGDPGRTDEEGDMERGGTAGGAAAVRHVWRWGRPVAGAGILLLLGWRLGGGPFLAGLRVVDGQALAAAVALGALTTVLSAWRWSLVARGLGMRLPLTAAVGDYYRSLFLNAVLPGGVLGDVHRAVRHGRDAGDVTRGVKAVVLERFAGQAVLLTAGAAVLLLDPAVPGHADAGPGTLLALGALVAVAVLGAVALRRRDAALGPGGRRWVAGLRTWPADVRRGLLTPGHRLPILAASAVVVAGHLATFAVAARSAGATAPLAQLLPLMLLPLMAMTVPVNIGGWGPREGAAAWAFGAAGLSSAQGLTVAVVYGLLALVASLPGAAVLVAGQLTSAWNRWDRA